jgi:TRAP-type mannitol/chloroaromatic compound transport system permease large subunit
MGVIAFNPMLKAGYDVKLASGVITAGGTLGILIPPSVMIIVYAAVAGQSVSSSTRRRCSRASSSRFSISSTSSAGR